VNEKHLAVSMTVVTLVILFIGAYYDHLQPGLLGCMTIIALFPATVVGLVFIDIVMTIFVDRWIERVRFGRNKNLEP
jgi:hypothetical protein